VNSIKERCAELELQIALRDAEIEYLVFALNRIALSYPHSWQATLAIAALRSRRVEIGSRTEPSGDRSQVDHAGDQRED
jgi:hypothetical protein